MTESATVPTKVSSVDEAYDPLGAERVVRQNCTSRKRFVDGTEDVRGRGQ